MAFSYSIKFDESTSILDFRRLQSAIEDIVKDQIQRHHPSLVANEDVTYGVNEVSFLSSSVHSRDDHKCLHAVTGELFCLPDGDVDDAA